MNPIMYNSEIFDDWNDSSFDVKECNEKNITPAIEISHDDWSPKRLNTEQLLINQGYDLSIFEPQKEVENKKVYEPEQLKTWTETEWFNYQIAYSEEQELAIRTKPVVITKYLKESLKRYLDGKELREQKKKMLEEGVNFKVVLEAIHGKNNIFEPDKIAETNLETKNQTQILTVGQTIKRTKHSSKRRTNNKRTRWKEKRSKIVNKGLTPLEEFIIFKSFK